MRISFVRMFDRWAQAKSVHTGQSPYAFIEVRRTAAVHSNTFEIKTSRHRRSFTFVTLVYEIGKEIVRKHQRKINQFWPNFKALCARREETKIRNFEDGIIFNWGRFRRSFFTSFFLSNITSVAEHHYSFYKRWEWHHNLSAIVSLALVKFARLKIQFRSLSHAATPPY